jgi:hypothetical protein
MRNSRNTRSNNPRDPPTVRLAARSKRSQPYARKVTARGLAPWAARWRVVSSAISSAAATAARR